MSLTYQQMAHLYREVKPLVEGAVCADVIPSGPDSFALHLKRSGEDYYLLLCLRERFLRFHLLPKPARDVGGPVSFVKKLSSHLKGEKIIDCTLLNDDRILALTFKKGQKAYRVVAEFLPRRANCYLMDTLQHIEGSLHPVDHLIYDLPMKPLQRHPEQAHVEEAVDLLDSHAVAALYEEIEGNEEFVRRKHEVEGEVKKHCQRARRRVEQGKQKLSDCLSWPEVNHMGMLLQSNLFRVSRGDKEVAVSDWEEEGKEKKIPLDPLKEPHDQVGQLFRKSKKLKAGLPHAERLLKDAEDDLVRWAGRQQALAYVATLRELEDFCVSCGLAEVPREKAVAAKPLPAKPYHLFRSAAGVEIWVGKSAKDNDKVSFQCANGLDWWLHARDCPGSHVVVRLPKGQELDDGTLHDAAELAMRYSKAKGQGSGEVTLTQVKYLVPVKGTPGKVMVSKHRSVRIKLDEKRWNRLKESRK